MLLAKHLDPLNDDLAERFSTIIVLLNNKSFFKEALLSNKSSIDEVLLSNRLDCATASCSTSSSRLHIREVQVYAVPETQRLNNKGGDWLEGKGTYRSAPSCPP
jgi:hypothetical protein